MRNTAARCFPSWATEAQRNARWRELSDQSQLGKNPWADGPGAAPRTRKTESSELLMPISTARAVELSAPPTKKPNGRLLRGQLELISDTRASGRNHRTPKMSREALEALIVGLCDHRLAAIEERVAALERRTNMLARDPRRPRLTGQPRPPSATTYRIISAVGSRCEPSLTVRELILICQVLERIAAWRSQCRCCRAAAQQPDEPSQPARDVRQLSHAFPSTWCFLCVCGRSSILSEALKSRVCLPQFNL